MNERNVRKQRWHRNIQNYIQSANVYGARLQNTFYHQVFKSKIKFTWNCGEDRHLCNWPGTTAGLHNWEYPFGKYLWEEALSIDGRLVSALVLNSRDRLDGVVTSELSADVSHRWYESGDELSACVIEYLLRNLKLERKRGH